MQVDINSDGTLDRLGHNRSQSPEEPAINRSPWTDIEFDYRNSAATHEEDGPKFVLAERWAPHTYQIGGVILLA